MRTVTRTFLTLVMMCAGLTVSIIFLDIVMHDLGGGAVSVSTLSDVPGQIAFSDKASRHLVVATADGSNRRTLSTEQVFSAPVWSSDGTQIAFVTRREGHSHLHVMNSDGAALTELVSADFIHALQWSPNSTHLFMVITKNDTQAISTLATDGTDLTVLAEMQEGQVIEIALSPDGAQMALTFDEGSVGEPIIFLMNADGTDLTQVTTSYSGSPSWSPDGSQIAFTQGTLKDHHIYIMDADGTNQRQVTDAWRRNDSGPAWSPDGIRLVFQSQYQPLVFTELGERPPPVIYTIRSDGTDEIRLLHPSQATAAYAASPVWSPDGQAIAFNGGTMGGSGICIVKADGSAVTLLVPQAEGPAWQP